MSTIKIQCPNQRCNRKLTLNQEPANKNHVIQCPKCRESRPFSKYITLTKQEPKVKKEPEVKEEPKVKQEPKVKPEPEVILGPQKGFCPHCYRPLTLPDKAILNNRKLLCKCGKKFSYDEVITKTTEAYCPHCNAKKVIPEISDHKQLSISCKECGNKTPYNQLLQPARCKECGKELLAPIGTKEIALCEECNRGTIPHQYIVDRIGSIIVTERGKEKRYQLNAGTNIIGRRASTSKADIQIDEPSQHMSREHLVINVVKKNNTWKHKASLVKRNDGNECRPVQIGPLTLKRSTDEATLNHDNVIKMPGATIRFVIE